MRKRTHVRGKKCAHEIDWESLASAGGGVVDVWCAKCGQSAGICVAKLVDMSDLDFDDDREEP
jgi:hypothetical protein